MKTYIVIDDIVRGEYHEQVIGSLEDFSKDIKIKKTYTPKKDHKTFIFPGCNIPRFKYKQFCERENISLVKYKERADVHFMNDDGVLNLLYNYDVDYRLIDSQVFIQYLNHILSLTSQDASHLRTLREVIRNNNNDCVLYKRIKYEHATYGNSSRPYGITYKDFRFKYNVKKDYIEDGENVWYARDLYSIKEDYIESFEAIKKYNIYHEDSILGQINSELTMDEELFEGAVNLIQNNEVSNHKLLMESMCNFNFRASAPYLLWLTHLGAAKMYASGMKEIGRAHV